ncbi:class I SAM-dependent DNA methyltransferase [Pseudactinotalea sp. Z1748]|uniref:class I SAM-dependent DNA methyltransferase n=1 Tax=Pseudactinotalea sp. Z1748 TaxID=3413027 RepID=UPI003C7E9D5C
MTERHDEFWNERLAQDWTSSGVGYQALGRPFNTWMYRIRRHVFAREVAALGVDSRTQVLDVGSGTGLYLAWWQAAGAGHVTGSDLTPAAVTRLRERFGTLRIEEFDVTAGPGPFEPGSFDVISCMDVLFHITDDELYRGALANVAALLRPGGRFIFTENFLNRAPDRSEHQVNRSRQWITRELARNGLRLERRTPSLVLMNAQVDAPWWWRKTWGGLLRGLTLTPPTGWATGALLYPLERVLTRVLAESPTTELAMAKRV